MRRWPAHVWIRVRNALEPLWVCGLALLQVRVVALWIPLQGSRLNLVQHLLLGTLFPLMLLTLTYARSRTGAARLSVRIVETILAAYAGWVGARYIVHQRGALVPVLTALMSLLFALFLAMRISRPPGMAVFRIRYRPEWNLRNLVRKGPVTLLALVALGVSWAASWRLGFWLPSKAGYLSSSLNLAVLIAASVLVASNLGLRAPLQVTARPRLISIGNLVALVLLAMMSFRVDTLGAPHPPSMLHNHFMGGFAFHHWAAIVGSAELVRQGGWLLWDVPSQYGFLSTLCLAGLPTGSVWQSLYIMHAALLFLSASVLFLILRSIRPGVLNLGFALSLTLAATFLLPGGTLISTGPFIHPPLGAYRYFWCYALLGVLSWDFLNRGDDPPRRATLLMGCAVWLLGTLWSAESAAYCAAIWIPSFTLLLIRRAVGLHPGPVLRGRRIRLVLGWMLVPAGMLAMTASAIWLYYVLRLGHGPDWIGFYEYMISFSGIAKPPPPFKPDGAVLAFALVFCVLATLATFLLRRGRLGGLGICVGATCALWAGSSYFIARGAESYALCAITHVAVGMGVALLILSRIGVAGWLAVLIKASCIPVLTVILTLGFGNPDHLPDWVQPLRRGYVRRVENLLPVVPPSLENLLEEAGVGVDDPVVYIQKDRPPRGFLDALGIMPLRRAAGGSHARWRCRAWLPTMPLELFAPLPEARSRLYMARFTARADSPGWLIEPKPATAYMFPWFFEELARSHTPVHAFESDEWRVTWYEPRRASGRATRSPQPAHLAAARAPSDRPRARH